MYQYRAKYLLSILFTLFVFKTFGQTGAVSNPTAGHENSPYSRFGIGETVNGNNTVLQGMGDITSAYANPYEVNADNPASYSFLNFTTYSAGAQGSLRTVASANQTYSTGTATLSYLNIGVPVGRHAGFSFGLRPQTRVYYNLADTVVSGIGKTQKLFSGDGGLNYAYVGGAYNYKGFSLGFNLGYMFGTIRNTSEINNIDTSTQSYNAVYNSEVSQYTKVGGLYWKGGLLYEGKLNKKLTIRAGGTLTISQNLNETIENYAIGYYYFADTLLNDTAYSSSHKNKLTLPTSYSLGVQIANTDKWDLGVDYTGTQWSQYRNFGAVDSNISSNSYKISLGGDYTPNAGSRSYWSRVTYRAGFYYGNDNITLQNTQLQYYGFTAGLSLPFKRSPSHVHAAIGIEHYGTKTNGLLEETIVKFTLGISFSDRWFVKRRYE